MNQEFPYIKLKVKKMNRQLKKSGQIHVFTTVECATMLAFAFIYLFKVT